MKALPVRMQEVWLHDLARPWRRPIRQMCTIIAGKKFVWAEHNGKRSLLGSSAFYLESNVMRRRKDDLCKIANNGYLRWAQPIKWSAAMKALRDESPCA